MWFPLIPFPSRSAQTFLIAQPLLPSLSPVADVLRAGPEEGAAASDTCGQDHWCHRPHHVPHCLCDFPDLLLHTLQGLLVGAGAAAAQQLKHQRNVIRKTMESKQWTSNKPQHWKAHQLNFITIDVPFQHQDHTNYILLAYVLRTGCGRGCGIGPWM